MFKQSPRDRRKCIVDRIARMLAEHIHRHNYPNIEATELFARLGVSRSAAENTWWSDIPELCDRAGLDLGIAIRDGKGGVVTLWPGENFGDSPATLTAEKIPAAPVGQKA